MRLCIMTLPILDKDMIRFFRKVDYTKTAPVRKHVTLKYIFTSYTPTENCIGPKLAPHGSCKHHVGQTWAPRTLLSGQMPNVN